MTIHSDYRAIDLMQTELEARRLRARWIRSAFSGLVGRSGR